MKQAEAADREKEDKGMSIPREIVIREDRLKAIDCAKQKILARSAERYERAKEDYYSNHFILGIKMTSKFKY